MAPARSITEADADRTVDLPVGTSLHILLTEQPSGGYRWELDGPSPDGVRIDGPAASYPAGTVGARSRIAWQVTALSPGSVELQFRLWRPWAGKSSIIRRLTFRLSIAP